MRPFLIATALPLQSVAEAGSAVVILCFVVDQLDLLQMQCQCVVFCWLYSGNAMVDASMPVQSALAVCQMARLVTRTRIIHKADTCLAPSSAAGCSNKLVYHEPRCHPQNSIGTPAISMAAV